MNRFINAVINTKDTISGIPVNPAPSKKLAPLTAITIPILV